MNPAEITVIYTLFVFLFYKGHYLLNRIQLSRTSVLYTVSLHAFNLSFFTSRFNFRIIYCLLLFACDMALTNFTLL